MQGFDCLEFNIGLFFSDIYLKIIVKSERLKSEIDP